MLKHIVGKFRANRYDVSHTSTVILNEKLIACTTAQLHESFVSRRVQNIFLFERWEKGRFPSLKNIIQNPSSIRRQVFWNQWQLELRKSLAHLVSLIMRLAGGNASVALRVYFI